MWLEIDYARSLGLPVLIFVLDDDAHWPVKWIDKSPEAMQRLGAFKKYLAENVLYVRFSSPEDLVVRVLTALRDVPPANRKPSSPSPVTGNRAASSSAEPGQQWGDSKTDALELAWRLVVDLRAQPELLLHLDPGQFWAAVDKAVVELGTGDTSGGVTPIDRLATSLAAVQAGLEPNRLWLAWMRQVHASKVEAVCARPLPSPAAAAAPNTPPSVEPSPATPSPQEDRGPRERAKKGSRKVRM